MGLLSLLRKLKLRERELRLLILGLDNAGKTTIVRRFNGESEEELRRISPTLGFNIFTLDFALELDDPADSAATAATSASAGSQDAPAKKQRRFANYKLNIWDVGGQKTIRSYWRNYFEQTDGIVWVVDSTDRHRLKDCREELEAVLKQERLAGATLLIFANKQDLPGAMSCGEIRQALGLDGPKGDSEAAESGGGGGAGQQPGGLGGLGSKRHWAIVSCSAVTGQGLLQGMKFLVGDISKRVFSWGD